ncbi:MAG: hypothetical protein ACI39F_03895 [Acutalibacteraceae bacterium]
MKIIGKMKTYSSKEITKSRVSIGFECLDRELFNPEKCYDPLYESGIKYARVQTGWAVCEKQKGIYNFEWLDKIVDSLIYRGIIPWFNVGFGNPLYMNDVDLSANSTCVGCVPIHYGEEATKAWKNFITALVNHYKHRISYYEIWNEPDCEQFWYPNKPDGKEYAYLVNLTAEIIKKIQPDAKTGGSAMGLFNLDFLNDFACSVNKENIVFFAYHAYSMKPENNYVTSVRNTMDLFRRNGLGHVEFWQGEGGCPSYFPKNHWLNNKCEGTERTQAIWIIRRFFLDLLAGTKLTSYFEMADLWEKPYEKAREVIDKPAAHGILNGLTYTKKQSYYVISRIATVLSGEIKLTSPKFKVFDKRQDEEEIITISFERNKKEILAYYKPYYIENVIDNRFEAEISLENTNIENPVIIDLYSGTVYECTTDNNVIKNAPIGQYPILVCSKNTFELEKQK